MIKGVCKLVLSLRTGVCRKELGLRPETPFDDDGDDSVSSYPWRRVYFDDYKHQIRFNLALTWVLCVLQMLFCGSPCSPGNVPNPTPGPLMSTPLVNTGQPTL